MGNTKAINLSIKGVDDDKALSVILERQQINYYVTYVYEFEGDVPVCNETIFTIEENK